METQGQIALRLLEATPDDLAMGLTFEGLFALLEETFEPLVAEGLKKKALEDSSLLSSFFRFPVSHLLRTVLTSLELVGGPRDASAFMRTLGERVARKTKDAPIAKAVMQLGGQDPHRVLTSFAAGCRTILTFGERTSEKLGERSARLVYKRELLGPAFSLGLMSKVFEIVPEKVQFAVTQANSSASNFAIELRW